MRKPYKVDEMSPREIAIHNKAQMWINTYEDKGAAKAAIFYYDHVCGTEDERLIVERMKEINGYV